MLKITHNLGKARTGIFKVNNKKIETPFFMPVATKAAPRHVLSEQLNTIGAKAIIANSLLLSLKPGNQLIKKHGGLHKFMNYKDIIFTDSGGFQVIRDFCQKITDKGIHFKSPFDGSHHLLTPKECMQNQNTIASDIAMVLDLMPLPNQNRSQVLYSLNKTYEWAKLCKQFHKNKKQLLFGICQGGFHKDLRKKSIQQITSLDFDGYALGGLAIGEPQKKTYDSMKTTSLLPENKLRYTMGIGHPDDIIQAVKQGIDCFDSVYPTQVARHNFMLTSKGILKITNKAFQNDKKPIDSNCNCFVCKNYSRAYIRYLTKINEPNAYILKSYHNLYYMQKFMERLREKIKKGKSL